MASFSTHCIGFSYFTVQRQIHIQDTTESNFRHNTCLTCAHYFSFVPPVWLHERHLEKRRTSLTWTKKVFLALHIADHSPGEWIRKGGFLTITTTCFRGVLRGSRTKASLTFLFGIFGSQLDKVVAWLSFSLHFALRCIVTECSACKHGEKRFGWRRESSGVVITVYWGRLCSN